MEELKPGCMSFLMIMLLLPVLLILGACAPGNAGETTAPATEPKPDMVKVTIQPNNGDPSIVTEVEKGSKLSDLPAPTKRACVLSGWVLSSGQAYDPDTAIEKNISVTAQWALAENAFQKDPNAGTRAEGTNIRVCSFNTLLPTVGSKVPVAGRDAGLFNMVSEYQPDVIAFQEFNADWADGFRTVFANTDYRLISGESSEVNGKTVTNTLAYNAAVLTLVEYDSFPYEVSDSTVSRVLTWAVFETKDGKRFIATSTHWALTEDQRLAEAEELAAWITKIAAEKKLPVIAMGDYNARDGALPYLQLMKKGALQDAKYTAAARGIVALTHHNRKVSSYTDELVNQCASIDHIFYTEGVQPLYYDTVLNEEIMTASDHNPIYTDFKFTS